MTDTRPDIIRAIDHASAALLALHGVKGVAYTELDAALRILAKIAQREKAAGSTAA